MSRLLSFLRYVLKFRSAMLLAFFVVVVGFVDETSFLHLFQLTQKNSELRQEIAQYEAQFAADSVAVHQLLTSQEAVEKVARVNLLMKTDNEDVYVVVEE